MTKEENIATLIEHLDHWKRLLSEKICDQDEGEKTIDALQNAIKALEQEPCEDAISRQAVLEAIDVKAWEFCDYLIREGRNDEQKPVSHFADNLRECVGDLQSVTPQQKIGHCKDCKNFEYDSVAEVHGIPLIVAHEICKRWGDGCQSKEDGYCFLFEPKTQESEDKE